MSQPPGHRSMSSDECHDRDHKRHRAEEGNKETGSAGREAVPAVGGDVVSVNDKTHNASHGLVAASVPMDERSDLFLGNRQGVDDPTAVRQRRPSGSSHGGGLSAVAAVPQPLERPRLLAEAMARVQKSLRVASANAPPCAQWPTMALHHDVASTLQMSVGTYSTCKTMHAIAAPSLSINGPIKEAAPDGIAQRWDALTDTRAVAKEALQHYVEDALVKLSIPKEEMSRRCDTRRVPRCVIQGAAGTGKTTALRLACEWFTASNNEQKQWRSLFATFDDENGLDSPAFDAHKGICARVAHRLLCAAINAQASLAATVDALRRELGLCPVAEGLKIYEWYAEPEILVQALRMALGVGDDDHLLLAVDDMQNLDTKGLPQNRDQHDAWNGLYYLRGLSQESFFCRRGKGVVLFVASAPPVNSDDKSPLHVLPLPPVDVEPFVDSTSEILALRNNNKALNKKQRTLLRKVLLQASFNAQCLRETYAKIIHATPSTSGIATHLESIEVDVVHAMTAKVDAFLGWSARHRHAHVFALLRALFWPCRVDLELRFSLGPEMHAALVGDTIGICAVVRYRDPKTCRCPRDTVHMNPWVCALLCSRLDKAMIDEARATMETPYEGTEYKIPRPGPDCSEAFVDTLRKLLSKVCEMGARGGGAGDDVSVYKQIGAGLRACRLATAPCYVSPEEWEVGPTRDDMRRTCPMIAYAGCYARGVPDK